MEKKQKKEYASPEVEVNLIELEEGIAAGSAMVRPENINDQVMEEWEEDPDDSRTFNW